ncbi:MAG TPA: hypothetical protein VFG47_00230, partial [Geminicoccaceae bacterium]|nr:hypothetical protein [Geminicoccaceae bacterium]
ISGDGNVVVFQTDANNLVPDDTNNLFDLFAKDLTTGETVRVSVAPNGAELTNASGWPAVNDDGSFAAFETQAPGLVGGGVNVNQVVRAPIDFGGGQAIAASEVLDDAEPVGGLEPGGPGAATPSAVAAAGAADVWLGLGLGLEQPSTGALAL